MKISLDTGLTHMRVSLPCLISLTGGATKTNSPRCWTRRRMMTFSMSDIRCAIRFGRTSRLICRPRTAGCGWVAFAASKVSRHTALSFTGPRVGASNTRIACRKSYRLGALFHRGCKCATPATIPVVLTRSICSLGRQWRTRTTRYGKGVALKVIAGTAVSQDIAGAENQSPRRIRRDVKIAQLAL